jgi:hypothetical protein
LSYEFPKGWTPIVDSKHFPPVDSRKPDGIANQCSKVLVWIQAPGKVEGRFSSIATLLAIDPGCFPGAVFPKSLSDKGKINKFADKIIKPYANTPFFSPYGATVSIAFSPKGRAMMRLTGGVILNAIEGRPAPAKEPLNANTSFALTESNGYWIAWAYLADEPSANELRNDVKISFEDAVVTDEGFQPAPPPVSAAGK